MGAGLPAIAVVPTLCVGMPLGTLRVRSWNRDAERQGMHSHAERGNDNVGAGLPAIAVGQLHFFQLTDCYRRQACSHI
ncbi:hypothetical protein B5P22_01550 [Pseudomonas tolaasii]|nr:hypothetical protein B5P22_01550 [Pseudomonas tolaasii]